MPTLYAESTQAFVSGDRTQAFGGDQTQAFGGGNDRTQAMTVAPCPICDTANPPGETYCGECGFLLGSTPGEESGPSRTLPKLVDAGGREFALQAGENIVGREGADILLPDRTVSRRHAKVVVEEGGVWVEDLGSTNGSKVSGDTLPAGRKASLADGTPVQFGSVKLTAVIPASSIRTLLALPAMPKADAPEERSGETPRLPQIAGSSGASSTARLARKDGTILTLKDARTTFGRRATNAVVIDDDSYMSGAHAEIYAENGRFFAIDVGSTNGTRLNGRLLSPKIGELLQDGDTITMGRTELRFLAPADGG